MKGSVFCRFPSKMKGSFPWRNSSPLKIGFSRGPGDGPLVGGEGGVGGRCYDFFSFDPFTHLFRTVPSESLFIFPFRQSRHHPSHYHTSFHHLPTWFPFILISDPDSLCLPSYLLISGILYDTQTRCGRPFPGLFLYLTLASTMTKP